MSVATRATNSTLAIALRFSERLIHFPHAKVGSKQKIADYLTHFHREPALDEGIWPTPNRGNELDALIKPILKELSALVSTCV